MQSKNIVFPVKAEVAFLEEVVPPLDAKSIRCTALASLVSLGTEGFCLGGEYDPQTYWEEYIQYPMHPGYSMVGRILEIGSAVTSFRVGQRVTTLAEHRQIFNIEAHQAFPIPDGVSDEEATWATLARTTQLGVRRADLKLGESVAVVGLGILGQLVTQYLSLMGAKRIIAIDTSIGRLELAKKGGATHTFCCGVHEASNAVKAITGTEMLDVVFDVTGHPAVLSPASLLLGKLGRLVLLGDSPTPSKQCLGPKIVGDSISILGIHGFMHPADASPFNKWTTAAMTDLFFDYLLSNRMNVKRLVTHRAPPSDAGEVYTKTAYESGVLGIILDWTDVE